MQVDKTGTIVWTTALDTLTPGAFFLLATIWFRDLDMNDLSMMRATKFGTSTHRLQKRELVQEGYLSVSQVGKGEYRYKVGENLNG